MIDFADGGITQDHLLQNFTWFRESGIKCERPEDEKIWSYMTNYFQGKLEMPSVETVVDYFTALKDTETLLQIKEIAAAQFYMRTNFRTLLDRLHEKQGKNINRLTAKKNDELLHTGKITWQEYEDRESKRLQEGALVFKPKASCGKDVFALTRQMMAEGPLVHVSTGIPYLDHTTGGGPVYGTRWYITAPPDGGKTGWIMQMVDHMSTPKERGGEGLCVAVLAVDEEPLDVLSRLAQRHGISRKECEERTPETIDRIQRVIYPRKIRFFDGSVTIEEAAKDLADWAASEETGGVLFIDSVQTAKSAKYESKLQIKEIVEQNASAIRDVASKYRIIVIATSEVNRASYVTISPSGVPDSHWTPLSAAKESGKIEYSGRVILSLARIEGNSDVSVVAIAKNKHGESYPSLQGLFYLSVDRATQTWTQCDAPVAEVADTPVDRKKAADQKLLRDNCKTVYEQIEANPEIGIKSLQSLQVEDSTKIGTKRLEAVLSRLSKEGRIIRSDKTLKYTAVPNVPETLPPIPVSYPYGSDVEDHDDPLLHLIYDPESPESNRIN